MMPICFHVVPEPAASRRKANEWISASVSRCVRPSSSVISASTSTLIRSSSGRSRRAETMGANISTIRSGWFSDSRTSSASSTGRPKLPVMVRTGMAAQKSTFNSARPSPSNESRSACTVRSIQFSVHHDTFAGEKEGWTSDR